MSREALFPDGSTHGNGLVAGETAMNRLRLITAAQALEIYIKSDGYWQLTRNGHRHAIINIIEPLSGKQFTTPSRRVTMKSCRDALAECRRLIAEIEATAIVYEGEEG